MADRIVTTGEDDRTPDWRVWPWIRNPQLWQLVALSLNIDPHKVKTNDDSWYGTPLIFYESQEFQNRLYAVCAIFGRDGVPAHPRSCPVSLRSFAALVRRIGWEAPPELLAMADEHDPGKQKTPMSAEEKPAAPAASHDTAAGAATSKHSANPFTSMDGLRWDEITIVFIGLDSVRVRARGRNETFTFDAMGFRHRTSHMAKPNECWKTFLHLAIVNTSNKTWNDVTRTPDLKKRISRLRTQLQEFFGIADDPITFTKCVGYQPAFNLIAEEHVIQDTRERYTDRADEDEGDDIQQVMIGRVHKHAAFPRLR